MNEKLIELLNKGATIEQLKEELNLNNRQLALKLNSLKNNGYLLNKKFHDGLGTEVMIQKKIARNNFCNNIEINFDNNKIRFLIVADTHYGNINDRFEYMDMLYDYASKKGIKSIIHLGDLIEGYSEFLGNSKALKMTDPLETAKYVIKNYPKDNNIVNYILLGNHDYRTINTNGVDISNIITKTILDMEFIGYFNGTIKLLNDCIGLHHPSIVSESRIDNIEYCNFYKNSRYNPSICLRGHYHSSEFYMYNDKPVLHAPSLFKDNNKIAGAWDMTLYFNKSLIEYMELQHLVVEPEVAKTLTLSHKFK